MNALSRLLSKIFGSARPAPGLSMERLREEDISWIVVGLGNPGAQYAATRHNVGYMAVDDLLAAAGDVLEPIQGVKAAGAVLPGGVLVLRSTTFMNLTGQAVGPIAQALGVGADHVIVIHDELDLPVHKVRLKQGGNENGHNGLKSISQHLGTRDYLRVRIGIARPPRGASIPEYVLGPVDSGAGFDEAVALAADAARAITTQGLSKAQNDIHSR